MVRIKFKVIQVGQELRDKLSAMKEPGETYNDLFERLLYKAERFDAIGVHPEGE